MPLLSDYARRRKIKYFLCDIPKTAKILDIGCGEGWVIEYLRKNGRNNCIGVDIIPPADIIGNINNWKELGLKDNTFDYIIAFEVIEHVDCINACYSLLKNNGKLLITTPLPNMDWLLKILEFLKLNQKRNSPHNNLVYLNTIERFQSNKIKLKAMLSQWAVFTK